MLHVGAAVIWVGGGLFLTIIALLAAAEHGPRSPQVQARLHRILLVARVDVALLFLIVFDMVAKPFS